MSLHRVSNNFEILALTLLISALVTLCTGSPIDITHPDKELEYFEYPVDTHPGAVELDTPKKVTETITGSGKPKRETILPQPSDLVEEDSESDSAKEEYSVEDESYQADEGYYYEEEETEQEETTEEETEVDDEEPEFLLRPSYFNSELDKETERR